MTVRFCYLPLKERRIMAKIIDITDKVEFGWNDDEALPLTRCVCGKKWNTWDFILGVEKDYPTECPSCGRRLFWSTHIRVFEIDP